MNSAMPPATGRTGAASRLRSPLGLATAGSRPVLPPILACPRADSDRSSLAWLVLAAIVGVGLLLRWDGWPQVIPHCGFHTVTGWPCPLCGTTRSFASAFRGEWRQAFAYNPLALFLAALAVGWAMLVVSGLRMRWGSTGACRLISRRGWIYCAILVVLANWVYLLFWATPFRRF